MVQKWYKNWSKIDPKIGTKLVPKMEQNGIKIVQKWSKYGQKWYKIGTKIGPKMVSKMVPKKVLKMVQKLV